MFIGVKQVVRVSKGLNNKYWFRTADDIQFALGEDDPRLRQAIRAIADIVEGLYEDPSTAAQDIEALCTKMNICDLVFPPGWNRIVADFLQAVDHHCPTTRIETIRQLDGNLYVMTAQPCHNTEFGSILTKYRAKAGKTCEECGISAVPGVGLKCCGALHVRTLCNECRCGEANSASNAKLVG